MVVFQAQEVSFTTVKAWEYNMTGHAEGCVDTYLALAGKKADSLKLVATPCIDDHQLSEEDFVVRGELADIACRVVLKVLYTARMCRVDVLYAVNALARDVTRWNVACDKRLHRLMCYLHHTKDYTQQC